MRNIIAAINMTIDGNCDHTAGIPDEEIHQHYQALLKKGDAILYGRITYELMTYWQSLIEKPSEDKSMNDFAEAIDSIPKIVFSHTLQNVTWESARLATGTLQEEVLDLKQQSGKDIYIGSRSLIIQLMKLNMIDEYQLCIHPVVAGKGLPLFENITDRTILNLTGSKVLKGGGVILYYEPGSKIIAL